MRVPQMGGKIGALHAPPPPCSTYERPPSGQIHLPVFTPSTISSTNCVLAPPSRPSISSSRHSGQRPGPSRCTWKVLLTGLHKADRVPHATAQDTSSYAPLFAA